MAEDDVQALNLSRIDTIWSLVLEAHHAPNGRRAEAMRLLLHRYGHAVLRYLMSVVGDADAAEDLAQELALRLVRGDFRAASPDRGRFRQLIKTAALNLVMDYHRRRKTRPSSLDAGVPEPQAESSEKEDLDREFVACWRARLLRLSWASLARHQERTGRPLYAVLRLRVRESGLSVAEMASRLEVTLGRRVTTGWVRQMLFRAREKYAARLLAEVWRSLESPTLEALEEELIELGLLAYCRRHLSRLEVGF